MQRIAFTARLASADLELLLAEVQRVAQDAGLELDVDRSAEVVDVALEAGDKAVRWRLARALDGAWHPLGIQHPAPAAPFRRFWQELLSGLDGAAWPYITARDEEGDEIRILRGRGPKRGLMVIDPRAYRDQRTKLVSDHG